VKRSPRLKVLEADHVVDLRLGGADRPKRPKFPSPEIERDSKIPIDHRRQQLIEGQSHASYVAERAARVLVGTWEPKNGVPATRADCPPDREQVGCPFYRCRHFLWRRDEPPGRPGLSAVPRDAAGLTIQVFGDMGPKAEPDLEPRWLETPLPPSCSLDVADKGQHTTPDLEEATGRHRTLTARVLRRAIASLKRRGITANDLIRLVDPEARPDEQPSQVSRGRRGPRT